MLGVGAQGRGNTIASSPCSASSIYPWPVCHGVVAQGPAAKRRILCVLGGRAGNARFRYDDAIFTTLSVNLCFEQSIFGGPALNFWREIWIPLLRYRPGRVSHFVLLSFHMTAGALLTVNIRGRSFMSTQAFAFCIDFLSFSLSTYLFISLPLLLPLLLSLSYSFSLLSITSPSLLFSPTFQFGVTRTTAHLLHIPSFSNLVFLPGSYQSNSSMCKSTS